MKTVRLSDIALIQSGGTPKRSNSLYWENGNIPWVKIGDIKSKYLKECEEFITVEGLKNSSAKIFNKGSILYTIFATLGEVAILDMDAATNQAIAGITVQDKRVNVEYLYYYLKSIKHDVNNLGRGVAQNNINLSILKNLSIPIRSDCEQIKIVNCLNFVTKIIEQKNRQLNLLDELVKSRFMEMFGDLANPQCRYYKCKLEELCSSPDDIKCGPFGTQLNKDEYQTEGVAIWEIPQINSEFNMKPTHFLTNEKARQLKAYSIRPGDIAMSRKGNVGKCALFPFKYEEGIIHSDVLRIRVDKNIVNPCFIVYQLHFSNAIKQQIKVISSGAIMAGINVTKLKGINVHVPSLKDQCKFSDFIDEINKSRLLFKCQLLQYHSIEHIIRGRNYG